MVTDAGGAARAATSSIAARSVHSPAKVEQAPSPGVMSGASAVDVTGITSAHARVGTSRTASANAIATTASRDMRPPLDERYRILLRIGNNPLPAAKNSV